jgi:hypothetical protein
MNQMIYSLKDIQADTATFKVNNIRYLYGQT